MEYGFYSGTQASEFGTCLYLNDKGESVIVSVVSPTLEMEHGYSDMKYVGPVEKFVKRLDKGSLYLHMD